MADEEFMRLAVEEAKKSEQSGGAPVGAVLVKDQRVVATGWGLVGLKKDPTAHAEAACLQAGCKNLDNLDLSGCTLYSTLESCSMCMGCAGWVGLKRIVFGAFREDVVGNDYELKDYHAVEHAKRFINKIEVVGGVLREECKQLMVGYKGWMRLD